MISIVTIAKTNIMPDYPKASDFIYFLNFKYRRSLDKIIEIFCYCYWWHYELWCKMRNESLQQKYHVTIEFFLLPSSFSFWFYFKKSLIASDKHFLISCTSFLFIAVTVLFVVDMVNILAHKAVKILAFRVHVVH